MLCRAQLRSLYRCKFFAPEKIAGPAAVVLEKATLRYIWRGMDANAIRRAVRNIVIFTGIGWSKVLLSEYVVVAQALLGKLNIRKRYAIMLRDSP